MHVGVLLSNLVDEACGHDNTKSKSARITFRYKPDFDGDKENDDDYDDEKYQCRYLCQ